MGDVNHHRTIINQYDDVIDLISNLKGVMTTEDFDWPTERIEISGPTEIDRGYYEVRINWTGNALLAMTGKEQEHFKYLLRELDQLSKPSIAEQILERHHSDSDELT